MQRLIDDEGLRLRLGVRGRESVAHLRIERYWERLRQFYDQVRDAVAGSGSQRPSGHAHGTDEDD